jgi:hypothetical protein
MTAVKGRLPNNWRIASAYDADTKQLSLTSPDIDLFNIDIDMNRLHAYNTMEHAPTGDTLMNAEVWAVFNKETGILRYDAEEKPEFWIEVDTNKVLKTKKRKKKNEEEIMMWKKITPPNSSVLTFWPGCIVRYRDIEELKEDFSKWFDIEPTPVGCVQTLPDKDSDGNDVPGTGGRYDFFFFINAKDMHKFAIKRFEFGMRWWEDVFFNDQQDIYPPEFISAYPIPGTKSTKV